MTQGALALTACPSKTTIAKINQNPSRYQNQQVGLIGTVTDSYGMLGNGIYELDDGTGRIWVMTTRGVPEFNVATRGMAYFHVTLRTGDRDLHSGMYGGAALNATHALLQALHRAGGREADHVGLAGPRAAGGRRRRLQASPGARHGRRAQPGRARAAQVAARKP